MENSKYTFTSLDQRASATITVVDYTALNLTAATGSITFGVPVDGDTVIVDGNTFTKVAATPGAGEFTDIIELEALVEAVTGVNSSQDGTTISITAATAGAAGNAITLALGVGNTGTMEISGATLTGGIDAGVITLDSTAKTEGTDWNAATSNAATATSLATALDAVAGFDASAVGNVVTVYWTTPGTAGNEKTLVTSDAVNLTISGDTLAGGVAATYSDKFDFSTMEEQSKVGAVLNVTALTGTSPTVDVTPQYSFDEETWFDSSTVFTQKTATGSEGVSLSFTGAMLRYKIVLGGTNPIATGKIFSIAK